MSFASRLFGPPGEVKRLVNQIKTGADKPINTLEPVLAELARIGEPAVEPLCAVLKDSRSSYAVRFLAAMALRRIGSASEEPLRALLSDKNEEVRAVASAALQLIQKDA